MLTDTLIADDVWSEAPEEPGPAFLFIALAANKRLRELEYNEDARGQHDIVTWRNQYMCELSAVADQLGVTGLHQLDKALASEAGRVEFDVRLARVITRLRAANRAELKIDAVALPLQKREDIRSHLEELRIKINNSSLSEAARDALNKKVDAVEAELDKRRFSLAPLWLLAGSLSITSVGLLSDLGGALETIGKVQELVGHEKAKEIAYEQRLAAPALTHDKVLQITDRSGEAD